MPSSDCDAPNVPEIVSSAAANSNCGQHRRVTAQASHVLPPSQKAQEIPCKSLVQFSGLTVRCSGYPDYAAQSRRTVSPSLPANLNATRIVKEEWRLSRARPSSRTSRTTIVSDSPEFGDDNSIAVFFIQCATVECYWYLVMTGFHGRRLGDELGSTVLCSNHFLHHDCNSTGFRVQIWRQ